MWQKVSMKHLFEVFLSVRISLLSEVVVQTFLQSYELSYTCYQLSGRTKLIFTKITIFVRFFNIVNNFVCLFKFTHILMVVCTRTEHQQFGRVPRSSAQHRDAAGLFPQRRLQRAGHGQDLPQRHGRGRYRRELDQLHHGQGQVEDNE